jgi:signal transduction histidine kinase
VEAMPEGGVMTLSSGRCDSGEMVQIGIKDSGIGIKPEDVERIFNLYFSTKQGGSGLGLTLALRAVDLHGGSVDVESKMGAGTTFRIQLPANNGATPPRLPAKS